VESKVKLFGHPIHPMLIVLPLGLLSTAVVFDVIYMLTGDEVFSSVAFWNIAAGVIGGRDVRQQSNCSKQRATNRADTHNISPRLKVLQAHPKDGLDQSHKRRCAVMPVTGATILM